MTDPNRTFGAAAVAAMFAQARREQRPAFLPYYPVGYPTLADSLDAIVAMAQAGVDGFEIGVPFSDPLADGPVIQAASQVALDNGITVSKALEAVRELRARGVTQPMLMFGYLNPIIAYGVEQYITDAKAAGADGFIIPDLPADEAPRFAACEREGMALVFFLAPTSNPERIRMASTAAKGFIYVVSVTGITGARADLPDDLTAFIARLRAETDKPLVLGFGISKPEHVRMMSDLVDGYIVGSALVRAGQHGPDAVRDLAVSLLPVIR
jgi:tryptophan synthase alpha chain